MLTALSFVRYDTTSSGSKCAIWLWQCDCGKTIEANATIVRSGRRTSCGCKANAARVVNAKEAPQKSGKLVENTYLPRLKLNNIPKNNTSGYRGVYFNTRQQKWVAQIYFKGKLIVLGAFSDPRTASEAYQIAKQELHGGMLAKYGMEMDEKSDGENEEK